MAENGVHKPRLCKVVKGPDGYGFHLHGEKGKIGQKVRKIEEGSPAETSGLRVGDKIICVNGQNIEKETHQEVVKRIKERENEVELLVADLDTEAMFKEKGIPITIDLITNGGEVKEETSQEQAVHENDETDSSSTNTAKTNSAGSTAELRPRLCKLDKGDGGYGFNLHSEKGKPGRYIRSVDRDSPSDKAGMKAGDRIIEVNGTNMEFEKHAKLVTAIKESGTSVSLLVVDQETDDFFKSCEVTPTETHLTGPLPEPKPPKATTEEEHEGVGFLSMDLSMLKARTQSSKKKRGAPTSNWENRRAMFNEL